jgi:hypothetical protein
MKPECEFCTSYHSLGLPIDDLGECRRHPPVVMPFAWKEHLGDDNSHETILRHTVHPVVTPEHVCSEWAAKPIASHP